MTITPRIRLSTFNAHWGGTYSNLASISDFLRTAANRPSRCGADDRDFESRTLGLAKHSDVLCLQEFPLRYDKIKKAFVPKIETDELFGEFDFFCARTLNTSTYDQNNVPLPLRATNRNIGLVTGVRKEFCSSLVENFRPPRQKDDRSFERAFPVVRIQDPTTNREMLIVNVYGQSPRLVSRFNGAKSNLRALLLHLDRDSYSNDLPVVLAGDFNMPYKTLGAELGKFSHGERTQIAQVGATFPTMVIPQKVVDELTRYNSTYRIGLQFDHVVSFNGANIDYARVQPAFVGNSDHLPITAGISIQARVLQGNFQRVSARHSTSKGL